MGLRQGFNKAKKAYGSAKQKYDEYEMRKLAKLEKKADRLEKKAVQRKRIDDAKRRIAKSKGNSGVGNAVRQVSGIGSNISRNLSAFGGEPKRKPRRKKKGRNPPLRSAGNRIRL